MKQKNENKKIEIQKLKSAIDIEEVREIKRTGI
jgi:hypothetical protein